MPSRTADDLKLNLRVTLDPANDGRDFLAPLGLDPFNQILAAVKIERSLYLKLNEE
jgi:hypothetical protein